MKLKSGDTAKTPTGSIVTIITETLNGFYKVKYEDGALTSIHGDKLSPLVQQIEKPSKLKMAFALEQNFKEVMKHIEDGTHRLVSQEMQHDYDQRDKEHVISINLILKENE